MFLELHYRRRGCYSSCFYCLCACHVPHHCSLHHYQHEYYKCWQAAGVNVDVLCGSYCPSEEGRRGIPHRWCSFKVLLYPKRFVFYLLPPDLDRGSKHRRCHVCTDSFTVDMSQSERFDHVYWVPKTHVVYIVIYLSHLCLYLHLRVQRSKLLSYQTTGAGLKRALLSVPNLLTDT